MGRCAGPRRPVSRRLPPPRLTPAPPPGFVLDGAPPVHAEPENPPPPQGFTLDQPTGQAVDGDTLRMENGGNLRLFGIDAPESKQVGWDRNYQPVPIGQNSRVALDAITTPQAVPGPQQGSSYGRPVAPVTDNGLDLGRQQIRSGNALAAPSFMEQDVARRWRYMQAERLARLNRQGLHQIYAQTPSDFRHDPIASPDRETIAQFWDTPTPWAGIRPDDEKKYVELLQTAASPDEIVSFVKSAGADIDPADAARWIKDRDEYRTKGNDLPAYVRYGERPPVMTDQGDGAAGAGARGLANGVLPNFLEETGAIVDTFGGTNDRENVWNSDRRLADIYANNAAQNEAITRFDAFEHPYVTTGAQIAGGLAVPMGRVTSAADLAKFGAAYGAASGLGREGTIPQRLTSGVVGAGEGLALTVGGGKALEAAAPYVGKGLRYAGDKLGFRPSIADAPRVPDYIDVGSNPAPEVRQGPDGRSYQVDPVPPTSGRVPDRIDVGTSPPSYTPGSPPRIDTQYPGPVPGKPPSISDITPEVEAWARQQGIGGNVLLHGSKTPNIEAFDPYGKGNYGLFGQGTYLTDNAGVALGYTGKGLRGTDQSGRTLYSVGQNIKNPLDLDAKADPAQWAKLADQHGFQFEPGATNQQAYRALEDAVADQMLPKWEGAEIMSDAVRSMGHDGLTHIGGGRRGGAHAPRHRVMIALDPEQTTIRGSLPVGDMMRPPMRDRNWIDVGAGPRVPSRIDVGAIPPPPAGFKLDGQRAMEMSGERGPSISQDMPGHPVGEAPGQPYPISQPMSDAQRRALAETVAPGDVVPIPSNQVGSVEELAAAQDGRYAPVEAPNERDELTRRTVRAWNGAEVPKVGPIDMVGWLRLQGGVVDQGGELGHMGLNNAGRKLDFAGQEQRFGPLVNQSGMNLDDAALRAWEAGYFPELTERPSVNQFLDALRDTHEGRNRRFLPEDMGEIDRYHAAQSERYSIQQQRFETGQPVYEDRSVPAPEPQPFPPAQAYEEWPAGGPDFAGNIDLRKLETPQDIGRALDFTNRRVGFDAATRGRVSHAETERLASDLGMTPDALLARRRGQALNAEEALAARQILAKSGNELVNLARRVKSMETPGDDVVAEFQQAWMRHAAIQEQVSGMTAEAGRALQQFRMLANSRAVKADVLSAMVGSGGGRKRIQDAADILLDAVETGQPGKFNTVVEKGAKPQFRDKLTELWINSLLTNPATHVVNMTSNTLTALAQIPEHAVAWGVGKVRQALPNASADRVIGSEIGQRTFGLIQGAKEGARHFAQALRTGEPVDLVSKVEQQNMKAISGLKGEIVRIPTRLLGAEDEFFKGIARRMELNGLAARQARAEGLKGEAASRRIAELVTNPPDDLLAKSMDYARYVTFQQKLGPTASKLSGITQDHRWTKLFLPFVRTPTNLIKFATERSPVAPVLKSFRDDIRAGGARRDLAIAKMTVGTGFGAAMYEAALSGKITGSAPPDDAKSRLLYADGWQPYSVRIGDKWYSYKRLDPFSTTIGTAADLALLPDNMSEHQRENMATLFVASIMGNLASKTWLSGVSDFLGAITEPEMNASRLVNRLAGSLAVPAGVAGAARTIDPVSRDADTWTDAIQSRIPFASRSLPARRDIWGEQVTSEGGVGPDFVSPIYTSTAKNDPVNGEMLALDYAPSKVKDTIGGVKLSPQQHDRYQMEAGRRSHQKIGQLVAAPEWHGLDLETREALAQKAVKEAREEAKGVVLGPPRIDPARARLTALRKGQAALSPPPPPGFTVEGEAGGVNIYADLQKAIPGIQFTSGFRDYAYNQKLKRQGYPAADNTTHMDGNTLDMLPPPGKSLGWLRGEVARNYPKADLLVHAGHLHARFPGWYGAPVLGGAKPAGVRNPFAGMPAPPRGFKVN